VSGPRL